MLIAGAKSFDMSPRPGVELAGYPHYPRPNEGVHDPLYAGCLYLNSDGEELALVALDILFFSKKYVRAVRARAASRCGIDPERVLVCCSHTHSGPWASGRLDMEALLSGAGPDEAYVESLVEGITSMIAEAKRDAFPAALGVGTGRCGAERGVGGNRRVQGGPADPTVGVIAVKDESNALRALFVNYALHPTFIHEDSALVTADYPGFIRQRVLERFPGAVFGFAQGASGDQSSRYFRKGQSYGEAERVGNALADTAFEAIDGLRFDRAPRFAVCKAELPFTLRKYPPVEALKEAADRAIREYEHLRDTGADYLAVQNANLRMLGAEDILGYATMLKRGDEIPLLADESPAEVVAVRLGEMCLGLVPGEVFVEYALRARAESPFPLTLVLELANGCLPGYCYTPDSLTQGGYEVDTSMLAPEFGSAMTDVLIAQMRRAWEA